jgi:hypothetical protein
VRASVGDEGVAEQLSTVKFITFIIFATFAKFAKFATFDRTQDISSMEPRQAPRPIRVEKHHLDATTPSPVFDGPGTEGAVEGEGRR